MAARLTTFRDLIESLVDGSGGIALDQNHTKLKRAVNEATRDLFNIHKWKYALREHTVQLLASQGTSTVTYTHSSRALDIAAGTWPAMAHPQNWRVLISGNVYQVYARTSSTQLTLDPVLNPGADIAAGAEYVVFDNTYDLPDDFGGAHGFYASGTMLSFYLEPHEWKWWESHGGTSATPFYWTIMASPQTRGKWALRLLGYPSEAKPIFMLYRQQATDLKWAGTETAATVGSVSTTSGSATITGTSTTFDSSMEGRVIRIGASSGSVIPTNNDGLTPYSEELRIKTVSSATSAIAFTAASQSLTTSKYCISDLVDIAPPMLNALIAGTAWKLEGDRKLRAEKEQEYYREVRRAMEADSHQLDLKGAWGGPLNGWLFYELILNPPN